MVVYLWQEELRYPSGYTPRGFTSSPGPNQGFSGFTSTKAVLAQTFADSDFVVEDDDVDIENELWSTSILHGRGV